MKTEIGDIEFWNTCIADLKEQAKHAKTLKDKIYLAQSLCKSRYCLKYAESKILVIVLLALLLCAGCAKMLGGAGQIIDGFGDGLSYAGQHLQELVKE